MNRLRVGDVIPVTGTLTAQTTPRAIALAVLARALGIVAAQQREIAEWRGLADALALELEMVYSLHDQGAAAEAALA